ncbi:MAG: tRNA pseudouridine(38-40) synthase TruA [Candidatus Omnitrophica bacterium]|nr:tRNA pseudouridine(38-40) synthase TruA [Candidatus Omnitrophota bacterium]
MSNKNIKLTLSYNGANFSGWQNQKSGRTVQETIEHAIKTITGEKVKLTGCGRTDSKVHAISYTANFKTDSRLAPAQIKNALNATLPEDIRIKTASIAKPDFHSRYGAKRKTYRYLILCGEENPFLKEFVCNVKGELNIPEMKKAAAHFIGEHDFSAYQAAGSAIKNTTRTIYKITIKKEKFTLDNSIKLIAIEITANGFLYKMARNIIGTLLYAGKGKLSLQAIPSIINSGDRRKAPPTASASGLYLKQVLY